MRVIYICPFTGLCGGTKVIAEHVLGLVKLGHQAEWWGLQPAPSWRGGGLPYVQFNGTNSLGMALRATRGIKVATWWETASWVAPNLLPGDKGYYLVQDIDQETYSNDRSGTSYRLGLTTITESQFVHDDLLVRYGVDSVNVGIGVGDNFHPIDIVPDLDRVFTTYRPLAGPNDLKGWHTALRAVRLARQDNKQISLVTFGMHGNPSVPGDVPHIHVPAPGDDKLRELYSQAGCYLMSSNREGFGLPAAEAMACGCPVVCTDAGGNREFCHHGVTALVGHTGEELSEHILVLRNDSALRTRIAQAGYKKIKESYTWDQVIRKLEELYSG